MRLKGERLLSRRENPSGKESDKDLAQKVAVCLIKK